MLISQQLLELSWHDAWMHEARDADGHWVKGVGSELTHEAYGHGVVTAVRGKVATVRFDDGTVRQFGSLQEHEPVGEEKYFKTHIGPTDGDVPDPEHIDKFLAPEIPSVDKPWGPGGPWQSMDQYMIPYTTRGNAAIEAALRRGEMPDKPMDPEAVDRVIAKRHLTQDTELYRGIGLSPELKAMLVPGAEFSDKSYTSTTTAPQWADEFANFRITGTAPWANGEMKGEPHPGWEPARMVLHAKAGQEIGPGEPGLAEYVLPRDSRFRVTHVTKGADGMTEIHIDVLPVTGHTALTPVNYPDPRDRFLKNRTITPDGRVVYNNSNDQGAVELGWRFNPLEARNEHGEWTRGAGDVLSEIAKDAGEYKPPPADRTDQHGLKGSENPFVVKYGLSSKNIVAAFDAATPDEIEQGKRWYSDAHDVAVAIGKGDAMKGAAMLSAFSVQTDWATDMLNAASTLANGKVPEHGVGITSAVRNRAQAILDAKSNDEIDKLFPKVGSAKTRNFFHLILNGGDRPGDTEGHVVIDRHALSVAAGRRLTSQETVAPTYAELAEQHPDWTHEQAQAYKKTFPDDPTSSAYSYQHIADMYRAAAQEINARGGVQVSPHQLQAITWMHQLHQNDIDDAHLVELAAEAVAHGGKVSDVPGASSAKGLASAQSHRWAALAAYAKAHQLPVHSGTTALAHTISGQLELAFNPRELRDSRGRWTKFGGVGKAVAVMESEREGFSVSPRTGESPPGGYMVALDGHTHRYPAEILDDPDKLHRAIDDMLMSERDSFQGSDMYLGGWVEDGKLWLDPSQNVQDRAEAERLGRERDQVGIFDLDTFNTIDTGGSGGGRIIDHANQSPREGSRGLLGPAGRRAPGRGGEAGRRHPGGIAAQVTDLAGWEHELRDSHGRWTDAEAEASFKPVDVFLRGTSNEYRPGDVIGTHPDQDRFTDGNVTRFTNLPFYARGMSRDTGKPGRKAHVYVVEPTGDYSVDPGSPEMVKGHKSWVTSSPLRVVREWAPENAVELAGGWHDAWRHELRGRHGEWVKDPEAVAAVAASSLRIAVPRPSAQDPDRAALGRFMESVDQAVPKLLGGNGTHLDWDHKPPTVFPDAENPMYLAYIGWDGHVNFSQDTADSLRQGLEGNGPIKSPDAFLVSLHELIHAALPSDEKRVSNGDMQAYQDNAHQAIEEGFTELAATNHAEDFFKAAGIGDRPTPYVSGTGEPDRDWAASVRRYANMAEKKADELGEGISSGKYPRAVYQSAMDDLRSLASELRKDPYALDTMSFDDQFAGYLSKAQHAGDQSLFEWTARMRSEGHRLQSVPQDQHMTMAEYARKMADPANITSSNSWGHYPKWTADAYKWVADIARRLGDANDPVAIRKLSDQISQVGTASKPRIMAEQLLAASGLHDLTREQMARALASAEDQILASWSKDAPENVAALATGRLRSTVSAMRGEAAA